MHWNFSKWDWDQVFRILIPVLFALIFGLMLTFAGGALVLHLLFDAFLG